MPTMRLSMSTKAPDSGRSDQRVSAVTWNSTITPLPRRAAGDQRRAVGERRPGVLGRGRNRARPAPGASPSRRSAPACRRTGCRARSGERLRLIPAQAAAEDAAAAAQLHRNQLVVGGGEPRAGEAHQHAAVVDPSASGGRGASPATLPTSARIIIGRRWSTNCRDRLGRRAALGEPHVGERVERARQVDRSRRAAAARYRRSSR